MMIPRPKCEGQDCKLIGPALLFFVGLMCILLIGIINIPHIPEEPTMATDLITSDLVAELDRNKITLHYPRGTIDEALPQEWVDVVTERVGASPVGHMVWYYPAGSLFGHPLPTDVEGIMILGRISAAPHWQ